MSDDLASFRALRAVASLVNAGQDVEQTHRHVLTAFCRESGWVSGAIMRADPAQGSVEVVARYDPAGLRVEPERLWPLVESPARVALETGQPVILRDAQVADEYPGYKREAIACAYRTVVLLPMEIDGQPRDTVLAASARQVVDVSERELTFLQLVVHLGSIAIGKARSLERERAFNDRLGAVLRGNAALLDAVLNEGSVAALVDRLADMLTEPFCVVDLTSRRVWVRRSPWPDLVDEEAWTRSANADARSELLKLAYDHTDMPLIQDRDVSVRVGRRVLHAGAAVCTLKVDASVVGALVVFRDREGDGGLDDLLLDAARCALSVQLMRAQVRFTAEARTAEDVVLRLLDGTLTESDFAERAARADLALDGPGRLLLLAPQDPSRVSAASRAEALRGVFDRVRTFGRGGAVICREQIVALAPFNAKDESRWQAFVASALDEVRSTMGQDVIATSSRICKGRTDYPKAFGNGERVVQLARRLGRAGHVSERDFGPFPVLLSGLQAADMREFVGGLVGEIARHDGERRTSYIETLSCYLDHGCRIHASAAALSLHVTTLRYRLTRMRELFDVKMDTPDERLALQLAIRFVGVLASPPAVRPPAVRRKSRVGTSARG